MADMRFPRKISITKNAQEFYGACLTLAAAIKRYWSICQIYSLICLDLKLIKLDLFGLTDNLLDSIHWPSLTYLRFIQWNPDITSLGITMFPV